MIIKVSDMFSKHPAGRYFADGPFSGEQFRELFLVPALLAGQSVTIDCAGVMGFPSSFLEEAWGGLVREHGYHPRYIQDLISFVNEVDNIKSRVDGYLSDALEEKSGESYVIVEGAGFMSLRGLPL